MINYLKFNSRSKEGKCLSNFSNHNIIIKNKHFKTGEHCFHYMKYYYCSKKCDKNRKDGHQLYFNENDIVCREHRSGSGAGKPKENMSLIGDVEILKLEDPPDDPYYAVPDELEPRELSKLFGFINSNYNSCIFSSKFN